MTRARTAASEGRTSRTASCYPRAAQSAFECENGISGKFNDTIAQRTPTSKYAMAASILLSAANVQLASFAGGAGVRNFEMVSDNAVARRGGDEDSGAVRAVRGEVLDQAAPAKTFRGAVSVDAGT